MFLADFVAQKPQLLVCPLVAPVGVVVHKVDGIEDDMVVAMPFVDVGCDDILVLALEPFVCKLLADLMSNFRRNFTYIEGLNEVSGNDFWDLRSLLCREISCPFKLFGSTLRGSAPEGGNKQLVICLLGINDVGDCLVYSS